MKKLFQKLKNPKIFKPLIAILAVIVTIGSFLLFQLMQGRISIDNSLVSDPIISIAPTTPGTLTQLNVYENEHIQKGDPVAVVGGQTLYADTNGLIITANNQIGSIVGPTSPVAQMIDLSNMRIAGTIDENKGLDQVHVGQVVSFTVDALPGKTFWGYVDEISPSAKQTQAAFSISTERPTQQFVVYARFEAAKYPQIKNGMSAKMTVFTNTK